MAYTVPPPLTRGDFEKTLGAFEAFCRDNIAPLAEAMGLHLRASQRGWQHALAETHPDATQQLVGAMERMLGDFIETAAVLREDFAIRAGEAEEDGRQGARQNQMLIGARRLADINGLGEEIRYIRDTLKQAAALLGSRDGAEEAAAAVRHMHALAGELYERYMMQAPAFRTLSDYAVSPESVMGVSPSRSAAALKEAEKDPLKAAQAAYTAFMDKVYAASTFFTDSYMQDERRLVAAVLEALRPGLFSGLNDAIMGIDGAVTIYQSAAPYLLDKALLPETHYERREANYFINSATRGIASGKVEEARDMLHKVLEHLFAGGLDGILENKGLSPEDIDKAGRVLEGLHGQLDTLATAYAELHKAGYCERLYSHAASQQDGKEMAKTQTQTQAKPKGRPDTTAVATSAVDAFLEQLGVSVEDPLTDVETDRGDRYR